jgi:hypothetical protein
MERRQALLQNNHVIEHTLFILLDIVTLHLVDVDNGRILGKRRHLDVHEHVTDHYNYLADEKKVKRKSLGLEFCGVWDDTD